MTQYTRSIRTSATSSGVAAVELIAGAGKACKVREIGIAIVNATASTFALGRPAALGITPTTPVFLLDPLGGDSAAVRASLAVAWGTGPTIPASFMRQCSLPATAGAERIWKFEGRNFSANSGGILVPAGGSLILWTLSAVSIADVYFVIEE